MAGEGPFAESDPVAHDPRAQIDSQADPKEARGISGLYFEALEAVGCVGRQFLGLRRKMAGEGPLAETQLPTSSNRLHRRNTRRTFYRATCFWSSNRLTQADSPAGIFPEFLDSLTSLI
jgi:hypothetical protein